MKNNLCSKSFLILIILIIDVCTGVPQQYGGSPAYARAPSLTRTWSSSRASQPELHRTASDTRWGGRLSPSTRPSISLSGNGRQNSGSESWSAPYQRTQSSPNFQPQESFREPTSRAVRPSSSNRWESNSRNSYDDWFASFMNQISPYMPNGYSSRNYQPPKLTKEEELVQKQQRLRNNIKQTRSSLNYRNSYYSFMPLANTLDIKVKRQSVLPDTFICFARASTVDLMAPKLKVVFIGEDGYDAGGLTKEWFLLVSKIIFDPSNKIFRKVDEENFSLQFNPNCPLYDLILPFVGKIFALALYHGNLFNVSLIKPIYKQMLGKKVTLKDVESFDPDLYKNLLLTSQSDVTGWDLTFSADEVTDGGKTETHELIKGGKEIEVDETNKEDYIKELIKWKYVTSVKNQMDAFLRGFNEIIPSYLLNTFNEEELELALCGSPKIDVDSWKNSTVYENSGDINSKPVQWFWEVVRDFDDNMKSRLLQFVTGSPRVPVGGFKDFQNPFTIMLFGSPNSLPVAHTCFNRLDLPPYESKNQLKEKLEKAITETEGFHLV